MILPEVLILSLLLLLLLVQTLGHSLTIGSPWSFTTFSYLGMGRVKLPQQTWVCCQNDRCNTQALQEIVLVLEFGT